MKISKLIEQLQKLQSKHGDLEVAREDSDRASQVIKSVAVKTTPSEPFLDFVELS